MNTGRTLTQLAQELERQKDAKKDFKAPTTKIEILPPASKTSSVPQDRALRMNLDGIGTFTTNRRSNTQLASELKMPVKYFDYLQENEPEALASHLTARLHNANTTRLVRTLDGTARAFLSNRYRILDNFEVASAALPVLTTVPDLQVMSTEVTENRMYIKAMTPRLTFEVKKGDIVQAGIVLSNSEVGEGAVKIEPFFYRLVCLNGMIATEAAMRRYHVGRYSDDAENAYEVFKDDTLRADDAAFMLKMRDAISAAFDEPRFRLLAGNMTAAADRQIEKKANLDKIVEVVTTKFSLSDGDGANILSNLARGGSLTQWGLANAVTAVANDEKDYEKSTQFERVGGQIVALNSENWGAFMKQAIEASTTSVAVA